MEEQVHEMSERDKTKHAMVRFLGMHFQIAPLNNGASHSKHRKIENCANPMKKKQNKYSILSDTDLEKDNSC